MRNEGGGVRANLLRRCHECGQPLGKKDLFCPRCGTKQRRAGIEIAAAGVDVVQFDEPAFNVYRDEVRD